jgi:hypothetical protein
MDINAQSLKEQLAGITTYDEFQQLRQSLSNHKQDDLYRFLFKLAINGREDLAPKMAGYMLIELQPNCSDTLYDVLTQIHLSSYFLSFREVPFYLVTQFGKHTLLDEAKQFVKKLPKDKSENSRVDTIIYWASMPASELCKGFHDWESEAFLEAAENSNSHE